MTEGTRVHCFGAEEVSSRYTKKIHKNTIHIKKYEMSFTHVTTTGLDWLHSSLSGITLASPQRLHVEKSINQGTSQRHKEIPCNQKFVASQKSP